jgi:uncharacterized protein YbaR (Trm112 family)
VALPKEMSAMDDNPRPDAKTPDATAMPERVDRRLLELLVCPVTKGPLEYDEARQELISRKAHLAFPIRRGVPHLLPTEARHLDD